MFFRKKKEKTFMEREIYAQPKILNDILECYVKDDEIKFDIPEGIEKVILVASGSSYNCARFSADLFDKIANIEASAVYSSEFLLKSIIPHSPNMLYIFITQSGETSDTNKALMKAKEYNLKTLCITNSENSSIWKLADYQINCHAGEEKSIAATKSLTAQMLCTTLLVLKYAQLKNIDVSFYLKELKTLPYAVENTLALRHNIHCFAKILLTYQNIVITADGIAYALARETALKMKETTYLNINSYILGEFMHGHVAVLNTKSALLYIATSDLNYTSTKNLNKIKKDYKPFVFLIGNANDKINANVNINVSIESPLVKSFAVVVISQMFALEMAQRLKHNVDKPHGLEKVVQ